MSWRERFVVMMGGLVLMSAGGWAQGPFRTAADGATFNVSRAGAPILRYRFAEVPFKPYVDLWFTPGGVNVLRDAPHDHLHHHALMFAVKVDGVNFWEETPAAGHQIHLSHEPVEGADRAGFVERLEWRDAEGKALLLETRTVTVWGGETLGAQVLTWESHFEPAGAASRTISGSHYQGLGMRFLESMDKDGRFLNEAEDEGENVRGTEMLVRGAWAAYQAVADGSAVTVAMFDHPDNLRPALWFTMTAPFAYLSATMNYWREPVDVTADAPLRARYGVAVWDGHADRKQIDELCQRWIALESGAHRGTE